jgi:hypothetical protein
MPALDMIAKGANPESKIEPMDNEWAAVDPDGAYDAYLEQFTNRPAVGIEKGRRAGLTDGKTDKSRKRMAVARARAARKAQFDATIASGARPSDERLSAAWMVVMPMAPIVEKIAASKARWAARYLGSVVEDMPSEVIEKMVLLLAKSDEDLNLLRQAAEELGDSAKRSGKIPGEQLSDDERAERRKIAKARKWLMGMTNNRVMGALVDAYTAQHNLRWDNIEVISTVMASISGVGDDPLYSRHKADKAPAMMGGYFQSPGSINPSALAMTIAASITERRLDALTELLLDEDNRRTDGAFQWSDNAEKVFMLTPGASARWDAVVRATAGHADPRKSRGAAARMLCRETFAWLPSVIFAAVKSFDLGVVEHVTFVDGHQHAVIKSEFDLYKGADKDSVRRPIMPELRFVTPRDAAEAIAATIFTLTGVEVVESIAYA